MSPSKSLNKRASKILTKFAKSGDVPHTELVYHTPFQLLVSVVLSAQTTDKGVNRCMAPLYDGEFTPRTVVTMGQDEFLKKIRTIGLAPTKAKNVVCLSQIILENHAGEIPRTREDLEALPGVGRKTANVVLAEIYGEPTLAVDTHVFRVTKRLGLHAESTPAKAEQALLGVVDKKFLPAAHHWFIIHGRYVCTARAPKCEACVIRKLCPQIGV